MNYSDMSVEQLERSLSDTMRQALTECVESDSYTDSYGALPARGRGRTLAALHARHLIDDDMRLSALGREVLFLFCDQVFTLDELHAEALEEDREYAPVPTANNTLAYAVLDAIDADPKSWDQRNWFTKTHCGTAACFAGHALLLSGARPYFRELAEAAFSAKLPDGQKVDVSPYARGLLRLEGWQAEQLFEGGNTRSDLGVLVRKFFGPRATAAQQNVQHSEHSEASA